VSLRNFIRLTGQRLGHEVPLATARRWDGFWTLGIRVASTGPSGWRSGSDSSVLGTIRVFPQRTNQT
jgi:hypothetical protein